MRVESLAIRNFRRFARVDLEWPDGVVALVGRNGAGKSTLLEAIGWCLYGNEAARTEKDLIKRRGAGPADDVRVRLAFRFGGHAYEVTRELLGKSGEHVATVTVDGNVHVASGAQSAREATAFVARLFHMDREAFFTSLVARQNELSALTDARPADRKRLLIGLLRLDALDRAIALARERKREARAQLDGLRSALRDVAPLREALAGAQAAVASARGAVSACEERIAALVVEVEDVRARRDAERKRRDEFQHAAFEAQAAAHRVATLAQQRAERDRELARAREAAALVATLAPQLEGLATAKAAVERWTALRIRHQELALVLRELAAAEGEAARAASERDAAGQALAAQPGVRRMLERLAEERPAGEARLATAQRSEAQADTRAREEARLLAEAEQRAASVRDLGPEAPCPTCARPLGEHQALLLHGFAAEIQRRREALAALASAREAAGREAAAARQTLVDQAAREQELQRKAQALAREESRRDAAVASLAAASARAERLRAQAAALKAEPFDPRASDAALAEVRRLEQIQAQHARAAAAAERADEIARILAELDASAAAARAAEAAARARRDALQFDAAAHDALERACGEAESRLLQARLERERAAAEAQLRAAEEARLAAELAQQEALAARAAALEARATRLEHVAGILPEFKDHLIGRIRPLLSAHAGRLFRELTDGRYADLEVAEDYDLLVNDDGKTFPLTRFSGGEADLANLCLRLAVSQVVAERAGVEDFAFLALDEVFGSQDEVRKGNILRTLRALGGRFRQIVLVTHVDDVKDAAEGVLRVRALDDGTSEVVSESGG